MSSFALIGVFFFFLLILVAIESLCLCRGQPLPLCLSLPGTAFEQTSFMPLSSSQRDGDNNSN